MAVESRVHDCVTDDAMDAERAPVRAGGRVGPGLVSLLLRGPPPGNNNGHPWLSMPPPPFCWSGCAGVVQVPDLCYLRACRARGAWWRPDCRPWPCRTNECNKSSLMPGSRSAGHAHFGCQSRENGSRKTSQGSRIRRSRVGFGRSVNVVACGRSSWSFSRAKSQPQQQHHPASERVAYGRRLLLWCFSNICASSASIWTAGRRQIVPVLPFRTR
ncbi:hypothetical protein BKA81DRAFT_417080 [Phyllosticta paracitricarpa]